MTLVVPRPRLLLPGTVGIDVQGVKRALSRAGYMEWGQFTETYGSFMTTAVAGFQHDHDITPVGKGYGDLTHHALVATHAKGKPAEWSFDAYAISLMKQEAAILKVTPEERVRQAIMSAAFFWYSNRSRIPYEEYRPFSLVKPPDLPTTPWDCSAFVTNCHYAGGAPDPNSRHYIDGQGYTGTLMGTGTRCNLRDMKPGDLIFYGFYSGPPSGAFPSGSPTHVSIFTGWQGGVPMTISNGRYPMSYTSIYYRSDLNHFRTYRVV